jgi:hypothetical protein
VGWLPRWMKGAACGWQVERGLAGDVDGVP